MAGRGRNQPQPQALQGADPALVQILQMMQNRDASRDNSRKQFLMFPKESFTGEDKKKAKSHWAKFSKYLDYQDQQGTIPRDLAHLPEIKSMFKFTLQDIALGWFKTESPNWLTEDQMKQAFLKRFNPWGHTRHQQQDAWNKLKFDMTKDDVDAFVVDMKMLASILGHNDDVIMEKFKDIFPDPNIKAALIAMDNFAAMQTKAKQLVQIYKPAHDSPMASAAILVHTAGNTPTKSKSSQVKSNQHQLAPINQPQDNPNTGETEYNGDKKMQPNFQEPVVEYCEPDQVIDICSYNHYQVLDKSSQKQEQHNDDNDIYNTSELEHEFEYGIYEDVFKTEQLMAELKRIDEAEKENKKLRDVQFEDFPLEQLVE